MARRMLTVRLADELVETLKEKAEADAIPVTELVTRLLRRGLNEAGEPKANDEIASLEQRLHQLENRLEKSAIEQRLHQLENRFEKSTGQFEILESLFTRMIRVSA